MINKALRIAYDAHEGSVDKGGAPYILHPISVALDVASHGGDVDAIVAALLHDVVEDTSISLQNLRDEGVSECCLEALALLTHDKTVPYMDYVSTVRNNSIARVVKMADLRNNMDESRLVFVTDKDRERIEKYKKAYALLSEEE